MAFGVELGVATTDKYHRRRTRCHRQCCCRLTISYAVVRVFATNFRQHQKAIRQTNCKIRKCENAKCYYLCAKVQIQQSALALCRPE